MYKPETVIRRGQNATVRRVCKLRDEQGGSARSERQPKPDHESALQSEIAPGK